VSESRGSIEEIVRQASTRILQIQEVITGRTRKRSVRHSRGRMNAMTINHLMFLHLRVGPAFREKSSAIDKMSATKVSRQWNVTMCNSVVELKITVEIEPPRGGVIPEYRMSTITSLRKFNGNSILREYSDNLFSDSNSLTQLRQATLSRCNIDCFSAQSRKRFVHEKSSGIHRAAQSDSSPVYILSHKYDLPF
jgi:hypothetical protein